MIGSWKRFSAWRSKRLSDENIKPPATSNKKFSSALNYIDVKIGTKFDGSCLSRINSHLITKM